MANKRIFAIPILLFLSLLSIKTATQSPGVVILSDDQDQYPLDLQLEILEDKEGAGNDRRWAERLLLQPLSSS